MVAVKIPIQKALDRARDDSLSAMCGGDIFETAWKSRVQALVRAARDRGITEVCYEGLFDRAKRETEKTHGKRYP